MSATDERYTPIWLLNLVREQCGGFDLDPCSCAQANETVQAKEFWTKEQDGLSRPWSGIVWCNPPYSRGNIDRWAAKFREESLSGRVREAYFLVNAETSSKWFQALAAEFGFCLISKRLKFDTPEGLMPSASPKPSVLFHSRRRVLQRSKLSPLYSLGVWT